MIEAAAVEWGVGVEDMDGVTPLLFGSRLVSERGDGISPRNIFSAVL